MTLADSTAAPVVVESAAISTEITGQFATTTYDLVFRNPNNRQLEGTFEFALLGGQSVTRFALDIGGLLREAVPVAKERGRVIFEEIQRRRVDPGLLEQTAGNHYRARVFPLPAHGTRRIVIAYQEALVRDAGDEATFRLALDFSVPLRNFSLRVTSFGNGASVPKVRSTLPITWPAWRNSSVLSIDEHDIQLSGVFELTLPKREAASLVTQRFGGREYFYAEVPVPEFPVKQRPVPKVVGILWDASLSARDHDRAREFAFLERWFATVGDVEVRFVQVRDVAARPDTHVVRGGNWSGLRRAIKRVVYDGATSFDGLHDDPEVDEWLLFSDGLINYGTSATEARLPLVAPVHAIVVSEKADTTRLRGIAMRHRGEFVNLIDTGADVAAARVRCASVRVLGIERDPEAVAEIFPEVGAAVVGSQFAVAGVLRSERTTIRIRIGHAEEGAREIDLAVEAGVNASVLAARAWAGAKIDALAVDLERNRADIRRMSEAFGIVTAETSLIVLETLNDYVIYGVEPPPDLREQWEAHHLKVATLRGMDREAHLDYVVASFARRERWWELGYASSHRPIRGNRAVAAAPAASVSSGVGLHTEPADASWPVSAEWAAEDLDDEVIVLSPFQVSASAGGGGYTATSTLAGSRRRTSLRDIGFGRRRTNEDEAVERIPKGAPMLQAWSPGSGYMDRLHRASAGEWYGIYLEERAEHLRDAGFFLDVAGFLFDLQEEVLALRVLSNLAELQIEDAALLRVLGRRLMQASQPALALPQFERVLRIRGEDPQSRRDLALACAATGQNQRAVDLLWEVVSTPWHGRFPDIELIALGELNAIVATSAENLDLSDVDVRLRRNLDVGLRVVLMWDADNCDIDLWVDDPAGERAAYNHPLTRQGGLMSRDFTGGYGPEEFLLRDPKPGRYTVRIQYYGDERSTALGPVTAHVRLIRGFGTPAQTEESMTVRLTKSRQTVKVGIIDIPGEAAAMEVGYRSRHPSRKGPRGS